MRKISCLFFVIIFCQFAHAQLSVQYAAGLQPTTNLQYFKPVGNNLFVGDCIPFAHNGAYYLYWLLDSAHHSALHGLGGHQWALSISNDLVHWKNYPIAIGIDEEWEKSICTGSVVYANNKFYAFYATRLLLDGKVNEQLSYAISNDGIHFKKQQPNPFYTFAPGYSKRNFRDPKVIVDAQNMFHLFVSSSQDSSVIAGNKGCLVHLSSTDLIHWKVNEPILTGQPSVPECPDYFYWKGWYYLVYSDNSNTYYLKSKGAYGPWAEPKFQALNEDWTNVVKTAAFRNDRRIAAAWVPSRLDNKDDNREVFGGNLIFREIFQLADGTLGSKFATELLPATGKQIHPVLLHDSSVKVTDNKNFTLSATNGICAAHVENIPLNIRLTATIEVLGDNEEYGLYLRSDTKADSGYKLSFSAINSKVSLGNTSINGVAGLRKNITLDIIMKDDIIDVNIDGKRCIVNRVYEQKGNSVWFYVKHGAIRFKSVAITPLL